MVSRRLFLQSSAAAAASVSWRVRTARAAATPGVTDTEIKIGQTMFYSGPGSAYSVIGRTEAAYFKMINERGGVNGRTLNFISVDDAYSPPKTVEQTRRLVEQEQVAFLFGSPGTVTNSAVRGYLNDNKVPQLFIASGAGMFDDPQHYPWTMSFIPSYQIEARVYAKHVLATKPDAKIGVIYQNDDFGRDFLIGLRSGLGADRAGMVVRETSYELSEPTVDSQIVTLQGSGADVLLIAATSKFAAQTIRKAFELDWTPQRYLANVSASVTTLQAAGLDKSKGLITGGALKDPSDPRWKDDPDFKKWAAFVAKYLTAADLTNGYATFGYGSAILMVHVLKQCGNDLSRENIMRQAENIKDFELPTLWPGIKINTSPDNFIPIRQLQLASFNGEHWEPFGEIISG